RWLGSCRPAAPGLAFASWDTSAQSGGAGAAAAAAGTAAVRLPSRRAAAAATVAAPPSVFGRTIPWSPRFRALPGVTSAPGGAGVSQAAPRSATLVMVDFLHSLVMVSPGTVAPAHHELLVMIGRWKAMRAHDRGDHGGGRRQAWRM